MKLRNPEILESYNRSIFTDEFKSSYDYTVYLTADVLHLEDAESYFGTDHIGNIHLINSGYYRTPVEVPTPPVEFYLEQYGKVQFENRIRYDNSIYQHHKILDCYNLFRQSSPTRTPDFIVRLRFDVVVEMDIVAALNRLLRTTTTPASSPLQMLCCWDLYAVGKPPIMNWYCTCLENGYGTFEYTTPVPRKLPVIGAYHRMDRRRWTFAPERQLFEMLFKFCNDNGIDINEGIEENSHPSDWNRIRCRR